MAEIDSVEKYYEYVGRDLRSLEANKKFRMYPWTTDPSFALFDPFHSGVMDAE